MKPDKAGPALIERRHLGRHRRRFRASLLRLAQGRPLFFLHGMDGLEVRWMSSAQPRTRFEVFAPSHPGFGASELPDNFDTIDDVAYLYLDLLEKLGLADAIVVGMSFGGWLAAEITDQERRRRARNLSSVRRWGSALPTAGART